MAGTRSRHPPIPRSYARAGEEDDQPFMPGSGGGMKIQNSDSPPLAPSPGQGNSPEASGPSSPVHDEMWTRSLAPVRVSLQKTRSPLGLHDNTILGL